MAAVDFQRTMRFSRDRASVWAVITRVEQVAGWVSMVGDVTELEPLARYEAVLADKVGPFKLSADLEIEVTSLDEGRRVTAVADGEDRAVASRILVDVVVTLDDYEGGTEMDLSGRYEVTGKVATLGASMIRTKADAMLNEFVAGAERDLG